MRTASRLRSLAALGVLLASTGARAQLFDEAAVRTFLNGRHPTQRWKTGPTRWDAPLLRAVFPRLRFYYVYSPAPLPPGASQPELKAAYEREAERHRLTMLSRIVAIDALGRVTDITHPTVLNRWLPRPRTEDERKRVVAAIASLAMTERAAPQLFDPEAVTSVELEPRLRSYQVMSHALVVSVSFDATGWMVESHVTETRGMPPSLPHGTGPPMPVMSTPIGAPCEVRFSLERDRTLGGYQLTATAENMTDHEIVLSAPDACPRGAVVFAGLPEGYDYYRSCERGACAETRSTATWRLRPAQKVKLAVVSIEPRGSACNRPLAAGTYEVQFAIPFEGTACGSATTTLVIR